MKHYAGLDLSMESTQVCIVDGNGRKLVSEKVESSPEAIATMLERHGPVERAVWPAAGLVDTEIGCFHLSEVHNATKEVQPRVQA
ncbi:hypothetical protein [Novosphingobium sp. THN1]|uniref:hypothetical protein n=1 Tax=Novosphingobium sp. THN1 TaxID=1016987 RepID=UPI001F0855E5|nr:hypothetical protein [Novosphingobium sp. THN1]